MGYQTGPRQLELLDKLLLDSPRRSYAMRCSMPSMLRV